MKTNKRVLALCLALLLVCAVLPAPTAQGADVQPVLSAALAHQAVAIVVLTLAVLQVDGLVARRVGEDRGALALPAGQPG